MATRNAKGQFVKGHKGGPGRPPLADELPLVEGIKAATSAEKVAQLLDSLHERGLKGSDKAARTWLEYAVGRPRQTIELSGPNGQPIAIDDARAELAQRLADRLARSRTPGPDRQPDPESGGTTAV